MHVIKTGGALLARTDTKQRLADAWNERDEDWVIVHGGGPQLDQALRAVQGPPEKIDGLRVTTAAGADAVRRTLSLVGADLAAGLRAAGAPAIQIPPEHEVMQAVPKSSKRGDLGRVGTVTNIHTQAIRRALKRGQLPVVTPVGWDAEGPLNINADEGASVLAMVLDADRLVLATDVDAVQDAGGVDIPRLDPEEAGRLMESGVAEGGMHAKLGQANDALAGGVPEVRIGPVETAWDDSIGTSVMPVPKATVQG